MMDSGVGATRAPNDPTKVSSVIYQGSKNYGGSPMSVGRALGQPAAASQPPPVRMSHAATNTPSASASSMMTTTAPMPLAPNHRRHFEAPIAGTAGLPPLATQPKRRGPKVGSRRNQNGQAKWRQAPLEGGGKRRANRPPELSSYDSLNDPYAFHCDTMKTSESGANTYEHPVISTVQRTDHRQFGSNQTSQTTQFGHQPTRNQVNQRAQNINHHHQEDANSLRLRNTDATSSATRPINSCEPGELNPAIYNNIQNNYPYKNRNDQLNSNNHNTSYQACSSSSDKSSIRSQEVQNNNNSNYQFEASNQGQQNHLVGQYNSHKEFDCHPTRELGNFAEDMLAHKPQGQATMQPVVAGVSGGGNNVGHMQRQQQQQQQQQPPPLQHQMVHHHHPKASQNIGQHRLDEQANYYGANEQYTSEQQLYQDHQHQHHHHHQQQQPPQLPHHHNNHHPHTAPNNARFAATISTTGRPQQHQQHKQQMQQQYHPQQSQPQIQQPLQQAQPQVPPHQLPYQPASGYGVDHTHQQHHQPSGFASAAAGEPVVGLHPSRQRAGLGSGQAASNRPQLQQQPPLPPYANHQQQQPPVSVRPNNVQSNRNLNRQQPQPQEQPLPPQQHQLYKHNQLQQAQNPQHHPTNIPHLHHQQQPPQQHHQHHVPTPSSYPTQQNSAAYQAHQVNQSTAFMGDPMLEQYPSSSPTLLQQQLNRQSSGPPSQAVAPGQPVQQRGMPFTPTGPAKSRQQMIGPPSGSLPLPHPTGPQQAAQQSRGGRFCGGAASNVIDTHQVQEIPLVDSYVVDQAPPAQQPPTALPHPMGRHSMVNNPAHYNQPINHRIQSQAHQQSHRVPNMRQQPQPAMQPQPTMDNHLIGNPTPPLTPNAPNAPHLRQNNMTGPDDWQQQPQHDQLQPHGAYPNNVANGHPSQPPVGSLPPPPPQQQLMPHQRVPHPPVGHPQQQLAIGQAAPHQPTQQRVGMSPKTATSPANVHYHHHQSSSQHHQPALMDSHQPAQQLPLGPTSVRPGYQATHQNAAGATCYGIDVVNGQARLTLPLRDALLMGPFRIDHDRQFTSKVFHIKAELFETLSKSLNLANPQTATVIQELQFRAYLVQPTNINNNNNNNILPKNNEHSLLASNHHHHHQHHQPNQTNQVVTAGRSCNWPEMFQVSVNQQEVRLDRTKQAHRPVDVFQFCHLGDNVLDIQVNDCYCNHEFVLEAVDRPTIRAFMNSCFKSRLTPQEVCVQKLKCNFGSRGFCVQNGQLQSAGIINEYINEYSHQQGIELTKLRVSLRCPISSRRMRTPTRGHNCKHLQCFDLEDFLYLNRERSQWSCPICLASIPFTMLELDQHQMNIVQSMSSQLDTDDILIDSNGQWQAYYQPQPVVGSAALGHHNQQQSTAKSTGTFHPQPPFVGNVSGSPHKQSLIASNGPPPPQARHTPTGPPGPASPASWEPSTNNGSPLVHQPSESPLAGPVRRPMSAAVSPQVATGRRSADGSPLTKRPYAGQYASPQPPLGQPSPSLSMNQQQAPLSQSTAAVSNSDDLSPLALMERTIIEHEMGPPPFTDPSNLNSNPLRAAASGPNLHSPAASEQQQPQAQQQQQQQVIPESRPAPGGAGAVFSPASAPHHTAASSPATQQPAPTILHQQQAPPPSPMQQQHTSMPATPTSTVLLQGGPETPATPSNSMQQQQLIGQSSHITSTNAINGPQHQQQSSSGVDHQPLSNGSASAGSVTSTSTMTPSGQSLGSVGMGGDSRCNTAPLQANSGLDDLILPEGGNASSSGQYNHKSLAHGDGGSAMNHHQHLDNKSEILMGELMMNPNDKSSMLLEEAEWKQQLGKSEIVANFLTNSSQQSHMNKKQHHHHLNQFQHHHHQLDEGANKMLSGGLNPSDDDDDDDDQVNHSNGSSPGGQDLDQLGHFANYLGSGEPDDGAGLPPDDNILDLFER